MNAYSDLELPKSSKKRLIELEDLLKSWQGETITSAKICELTGWKDSLVRHDLWLIKKILTTQINKTPETVEEVNSSKDLFDFRGWKNGYKTAELLEAVHIANAGNKTPLNNTINVCIAGLGRLGAALLDDTLVEASSFVIKAGFDSNVNRVEVLRSTFPLYPASDMNWVIKQEKITLAILAVSEKDAQQMCDRLVKAGITGIVNMTRCVLRVPENVKVENLSILNSLKIVGL